MPALLNSQWRSTGLNASLFIMPITYRQWGTDLDANALQQMENACQLPVSVAAALMPDAHVGYGLPIGGVLATDNAVIPYAVGVDIACRVKLTVLDLPLRLAPPPRNRISSAPLKPRRASASARNSSIAAPIR